jgi:hypothetical protein
MPRISLDESARFWCAMGSAVAVIGGILLGVGVTKSQGNHSSLWSEGWFDAGFGVMLLGAFALVWALILYLAHRQAGVPQSPGSSARGPSGESPDAPPDRERRSNLPSVVTPAQALRTERGLRELRPLEVGLPLSQLPPGVYGFMPPWFVTNLEDALLDAQAGGTSVLEVHKTQDGELQLVGYVSQETATRISGAGTVLLFPEAWEEANEVVGIPRGRIVQADSGHFALGYKMELRLQSATGSR